jgi:hypothetical protein
MTQQAIGRLSVACCGAKSRRSLSNEWRTHRRTFGARGGPFKRDDETLADTYLQ